MRRKHFGILVVFLSVLIGIPSLSISIVNAATITRVSFDFYDSSGNPNGMGYLQFDTVDLDSWHLVADLPSFSSQFFVTDATGGMQYLYDAYLNLEANRTAEQAKLMIENQHPIYPVSFASHWQWDPLWLRYLYWAPGVVEFRVNADGTWRFSHGANSSLYIEGTYDASVWFDDPVPPGAPNPVPVPGTLILLVSGILGLAGFRRKLTKN